MRKYIDLLNEAMNEDSLIDKDLAPDANELSQGEHYAAERETGFFGAAASGTLIMAKSTGRMLFMKRSEEVNEPGDWGNCGGAIDQGQNGQRLSPVENAMKEAREESGYTGPVQMIPMFVFQKGTFKYYNFLGLVADEFEPHLGWEASEAKWCQYGDWPQPLHFGMQGLFSDPKSSKAIKHYAEMFASGNHAVESVEEDVTNEDITMPAGVNIPQAVNAGQNIANALARPAQNTDAAGNPIDANGNPIAQNGASTTPASTTTTPASTTGAPQAPASANGQPMQTQGGQNAPMMQPQSTAPAPQQQAPVPQGTPPKKSLAPITPQ